MALGIRMRWLRIAVLFVGASVAFLTHFRPWEVGFLEEWPLAEYWIQNGPVGFATHYFEWSLSRPLHLVPTAIGLLVSGGAPFGIFLMLGLVAAAQFLFMVWALRPMAPPYWVAVIVALFVALHPLWAGGYLQRFLPAQTAALSIVIALGFVVRWLRSSRSRWIVLAGVTIFLGIAVYPGSAAAGPLMALVVVLAVAATWRARIIAVAVATAAAALMTAYSFLVARWIDPNAATYESGNLAAGSIGGPRDLVKYVGGILIGPGIWLLIGIIAIAALAAVLALSGAIPHPAGWLMAATALVSPACAVVYFGNVAWLQDVERVAYATSLGLIAAVAVWPLASQPTRVKFQAAMAVVLAAASLIGAWQGIARWQPYIALQHQLFAELAPVVREANGDQIVVVVDHSGTFGTEYTLPQYYISSASHIMNNDDTRVWLCSLPQDPPLAIATPCNPRDTGSDLRLMRTFSVPNGTVDIFIGNPAQ